MADEYLPLLRGRVSAVDTYESPQRGGSSPKLPSIDPNAHTSKLLRQLDEIQRQAQERSETARDELATREIVAVRPISGAELTADQLDDRRRDARLIGVDPDTGTVLLDVAHPNLDYLRTKINEFGDDAKTTSKIERDGTITIHRSAERAIGPVDTIGLASLVDLQGPRLRTETVAENRPYWFEIACRGGYRRPTSETQDSRTQIGRQLQRVGASQHLQEFIGPEQVYFFTRLTQQQLESLLAIVDCIYEVELAPPSVRDLQLLEDMTTRDLRDFTLSPPPENAPSVVILDTGISTEHPLLKPAILSASSAAPDLFPSPEDTFGHGTKMAGLALYEDLGAAIERGNAIASHWIQSSRILVQPGAGTATDENYENWPVLTLNGVRSAEEADPRPRDRVYTLAVTRTMQDPPLDGLEPTLWSHAVDQIAYEGHGRLVIVAAGNARAGQWRALAEQYPQLQLSEKIHQPGQSSNALTVGAFTERVELPASVDYAEAEVVAKRSGGISPFTSTGLPGNEWSIKPEVVMEGGNLAVAGPLTDPSVSTLTALTTSHRHTLGSPLGQLSMTSEAAARAAYLAARVWSAEADLSPETIRGLIVHSATWTPEMFTQFPGLNDRLLACGYGVPDERVARQCAKNRATIVIEDVMPNAVVEEEPKKKLPKRSTTKVTEPKIRRKLKLYRLPIPDDLLGNSDPDAELRVTLSYFAEPNKFRRHVFHGLDLKWDMQGPQESEDEFLQRINAKKRPNGSDGKRQKLVAKKSFSWDVGIQPRSRGTVQSDRWRGKMSELVGDKLIAVVPVLGWWDQRRTMREQDMRFSLIVSVFGPGVYASIKPYVEIPVSAAIVV